MENESDKEKVERKLPVKLPTEQELQEARRIKLTKEELLHIIETALDLALEIRKQSKENPQAINSLMEMILLAKAENITYYVKQKED